MNVVHAGTVLLLALCAFTAFTARAAERGIYTVVDGDVRVLRKTTWYRLEPGARADDGDVVDVREHEQVQLELGSGTTLSIIGPALVHAAALPAHDAKPGTAADVTLLRGWCKASSTEKSAPLRLAFTGGALALADGIIVVHADPGHTEFFVESGRVRLVMPAPKGKEVARDATEGEFWHRTGDRAFETDDRPSSSFITAMPHELRDPMPELASRFQSAPPPLVAGREVTFAEAQPWLSGASRRAFARRFAPRLADRAFRAEAAAAPAVPEWDRTLHPERYRPRDADSAPDARAAPIPSAIR